MFYRLHVCVVNSWSWLFSFVLYNLDKFEEILKLMHHLDGKFVWGLNVKSTFSFVSNEEIISIILEGNNFWTRIILAITNYSIQYDNN